jgi:hypothetical protein
MLTLKKLQANQKQTQEFWGTITGPLQLRKLRLQFRDTCGKIPTLSLFIFSLKTFVGLVLAEQ